MMTPEKQKQITDLRLRRAQLKGKLASTDYQAIKYAEGELSISQYAPIREQRRAWRAEINALEAEINALRAPTL
jgi:hypothetical protein